MRPDNCLNEICLTAAEELDCGAGDTQIAGAVVGIVTAGGRRGVVSRGFAQRVPHVREMTDGTWFDLASLTKVMVTTPAILKLVAEGAFALDDPVAKVIPDLRQYDLNAPERALTFRQCLSHQTFLPAVAPIYTYGPDPETLKAFILQNPWPQGPSVYSDINFILLGIAIERVTGHPLSERPLPDGLSFAPDPAVTAATEDCQWRGRVLCGEVHDENAYALGGAAGHAGLFGTVDGVLDFAQTVLNGSGLPEVLHLAIRTPVSAERTVGWQIKHDNWPGGQACSDMTIGHTGFTGTGLWIDFDCGLAWTILTNRVHPSRHRDTGIIRKRKLAGDMIVRMFDEAA